MENETNIPNEEVVTPSPEEVLVKMKENLVPKEEAQKWQSKYNELFRSVANGTFSGEDKVPEKTEEELKAEFDSNIKTLTDTSKSIRPLDMFQKMLEVDDYLTSHGGRSCFAPSTGDIAPEIDASCTKMRSLLESVIAQADGSDEIALAYLGNHLSDPIGMSRNTRRI